MTVHMNRWTKCIWVFKGNQKMCQEIYLKSKHVHSGLGKTRNGKQIRTALLRSYNSILVVIDNIFAGPGFSVYFSSKNAQQHVISFFLNILGMLEGKHFKCLDMIFHFITENINRVAGYQGNPPVTNICPTYTTCNAIFSLPNYAPSSGKLNCWYW